MRKIILAIASLLPGFITLSIYRIMGYEIGKKVRIGFFTIIDVDKSAILEEGVRVGSFVYVKALRFQMQSYSIIRSFSYIRTPYVSIGRDSLLSSFVIVRSSHVSTDSELKIGDLVHIFPFVTLDCSRRIVIGDETGIGPQCDVFTHSAYKSVLDGYKVQYADVEIGKRVELTYRVFVAPGVKIGDDAICAYGSYVNKDVPSGVLAAGSPAAVKRTREQLLPDASGLNAEQTLLDIIESYKRDAPLLQNHPPLPVRISDQNACKLADNGCAYVITNGSIGKITAYVYCLFDIPRQLCLNHKIRTSDFNVLRKYLSRYGIRFRTSLSREDLV